MNRKDLLYSDRACDMAGILELFADDRKSGFYYLPDRTDEEYLIL